MKISTELRCNDTDRGKPKYWQTNLWQCHCFDYKPHLDLPGMEYRHPRRQTGD
jgi:hypothetical protein